MSKAFITFLYSNNAQESWAFYEDVLGLRLCVDQASCRIFEFCDGGFLGVCSKEDVDITENIIVTFVEDDIDGRYADLVAKGVETDGEPRQNDTYGIYHFFARDPDGYRLEFQRFLDPDWSKNETRS